MDAGNGAVLSLLVGVIAVVSIVQAISVLVLVLKFRKTTERLETLADQVSRDLQPVLVSAREFLTETREKVSAISANLVEITDIAKSQITRLDGLVTDVSGRARLQVIRVDQLITDTVSRVEETTETVRKTILTPVREISAILAGVRTTLDFLFRRNKAGVEHATQDEELFI